MISAIKFFGFALTIGSAFAGGSHDHHHHQQHLLGYRGYAPVSVLAAGPAYVAKSSPVLVSKGVPAYYAAHGHDNHHHGHLAIQDHHGHHALQGHHGHQALHGHYAHALHGHHGHAHAHAHAPVAYLPAAYAYAAPQAEHVALLSAAGKPKVYGKSIPAAAVRNVETVMVTKTITPVVTKTVTHRTHAEPALSIGHVQGYRQAAIGHPKIAPVQFNTAYTTYANPTVGINGPVVYSGPAVGYAKTVAVAEPAGKQVAAVAVGPEPVAYKTAGLASPYGAYAVYPGSALSLANYGYDAHSVPVANFLDLRTGKAVYASHGHNHGHAHGHNHGHHHHAAEHAYLHKK